MRIMKTLLVERAAAEAAVCGTDQCHDSIRRAGIATRANQHDGSTMAQAIDESIRQTIACRGQEQYWREGYDAMDAALRG